MKILVTGAAGFIGSQLAHKLHGEGHGLVLLDNFSYGKEDNLVFPDKDFRPEVIRGDVRDATLIRELVEKHGVEIIFHIAGIAPLPDCQTNPTEAVDVNVTGTVNILEAARRYGVKRVIFAATTAMYENDKVFPSKEGKFDLPTLVYPNTKYAAERFCQSYADSYGLPVTALRFANVYGPHIDCLRKQPPFVGYMIRELHYDRIPTFFSNGEQSRDYIYVDDLLDLATRVMHGTNLGFEAINVSSNVSYSVKQLFEITSRIMGKSITPNFADPSSYWNKYPALKEGAYPLKERILDEEVNKHTQCDNTLAKERYNWTPSISIEEGLRRTILSTVETLNHASKD